MTQLLNVGNLLRVAIPKQKLANWKSLFLHSYSLVAYWPFTYMYMTRCMCMHTHLHFCMFR